MALNAVIGRFDRAAADAICRFVRRGRRALLVGSSACCLMVGTASVISRPAQNRANQEKADQEIGEECSHRWGLAAGGKLTTLQAYRVLRIGQAVIPPGGIFRGDGNGTPTQPQETPGILSVLNKTCDAP